jgi:hypothetical protein
MPEGKYFVLVSRLNGCALGIENSTPGSKVITVQRNDSDEKQQWYIDLLNGTIRNRSNDHSIHEGGDSNAVLQKNEKGNSAQQFTLEGSLVLNRSNNKVLDITGANKKSGTPICVWKQNGAVNQQWDAVFQSPKYFVIKGKESKRAIDIEGASKNPGAKICLYDIHKNDNQLWYEDSFGRIRSKLNDFVFDSSSGDICMQPFDPHNPNRSWVINGKFIVQSGNPTIALDVKESKKDNGAAICGYNCHGRENQQWAIKYD